MNQNEAGKPSRLWVPLILLAIGTVAVAGYFINRQAQPDTLSENGKSKTRSDPYANVELLKEDDRLFLWDAENNGLELAKFGWSPLSAALIDGDREALQQQLADSFSAQIPKNGSTASAEFHYLKVAREISQGEQVELEKTEFVEWLQGLANRFTKVKKAKFSLKAIKPADRDKPKESWVGTALLSLKGQIVDEGIGRTSVLFDFEVKRPGNTAYEDGAWMRSLKVRQIETSSAGQFQMQEVSKQRGFTEALHDNWKVSADKTNVHTGGVFLFDFNRDSRTDVLLVDEPRANSVLLYKGIEDGHFENVTRQVGLHRTGQLAKAGVIDIDNDGWQDIVFPGVGVYRNNSGKGFENMTGASNLTRLIAAHGPLSNITGIAVADYDKDGLTDIYVTRGDAERFKSGSWIDGKTQTLWQNQLLRNAGQGRFEDVTLKTKTWGDNRSVFSASWLDANNDSWPDIYVIHEFGPGVLLLNNSEGEFEPKTISTDAGDFGSMGIISGDVNNDGLMDVYVSSMYSKAGNRVMDNIPEGFYSDDIMMKLRRMVAGSELYLNKGGLEFDSVGKKLQVSNVGWGWGASLADLNNDGWQDIYATCGFISRDRTKPDG